jgi:hypothetical protein
MTTGLARGRLCRVCAHARLDQIEAELARPGATKRAIASKFGLGRMSLVRHAQLHLPDRTRRAAEAQKAGAAAPDLLQQLQECVKFAKHAIAMANTDRSWAALNGAIAELRKTIVVIGKFRGQLNDGATVVNFNLSSDELARLAEGFLLTQRPLPTLPASVETEVVSSSPADTQEQPDPAEPEEED